MLLDGVFSAFSLFCLKPCPCMSFYVFLMQKKLEVGLMVSALDYNFAEENDSNHGRLQGSTSAYKGTDFFSN